MAHLPLDMFLQMGALSLALLLGPQQKAQIDLAMKDVMARQHIAGMSIGVAQDGRMLYARGYGFRDPQRRRNADRKTIYQVGSLTKQFTAACVLMLVRDGKLSLESTLSQYVPHYSKAATVTVRELLTQTSGIPSYTDDAAFAVWGKSRMSHDDVLAHVALLDLHFAPGTHWEYSNTNYFLLGMILERVSGMAYADFLRTRFLEPLHLHSTFYTGPDRKQDGDRAAGSAWNGAAFSPLELPAMDAAFSAGGLSSTVDDLTAWDAALLDGRVLPLSLAGLMTTQSVLPTGASGYGMGLMIASMYGRITVMHDGNIDGFSAFTGTVLPERLEITVLTNAERIDTIPIAKTLAAIAQPPAPAE
ncbi:MAG: serine hydrolase domain-containing protein [Vulcanimicrobiaceae bacterium]